MEDENTNPVLPSSRSNLVFFWVVGVTNRYLNHFLFPPFSLPYPNWDLYKAAGRSIWFLMKHNLIPVFIFYFLPFWTSRLSLNTRLQNYFFQLLKKMRLLVCKIISDHLTVCVQLVIWGVLFCHMLHIFLFFL